MLSPDLLKQVADLLMPMLRTKPQRKRWITAPFAALLELDWQSDLRSCTEKFVSMLSEPNSLPIQEQPLLVLLRILQTEVAESEKEKFTKLETSLEKLAQQERVDITQTGTYPDLVDGDDIDVGNIQSSIVAIGDGAEANVNTYIQQIAAAEQADKTRERDLRLLAEGVREYTHRLGKLIVHNQLSKDTEPYRGLVAYSVADIEYFYGREKAIKDILRLMRNQRLVILQSQSGAGKSSLLAAGIASRLLANQDLVIIIRPYDVEPGQKIKQTLFSGLEEAITVKQARLRSFLYDVTKIVGEQTRIYLILDQFEEFFMAQRDETARKQFIADLQACYEDSTLNVHWLLSTRSEHFGHLASFQPQIVNPFANTYYLHRLTTTEARDVIVKPAARFGIHIEEALVDKLLTELKQPESDEVNPPQLQLVCSAIYTAFIDQRDKTTPPGDTITLDLYDQLGQTKVILDNHVKRVLNQAFEHIEERQLARRTLTELVSSEQRRIRLTRQELQDRLAKVSSSSASLYKVLEILVSQRLLVTVPDQDGEQSHYELTHDYLLNEIQIDPETKAQKAAQELLAQEVDDYRQHKTLLSSEKYAIINSQRAFLTVDELGQELLNRSETTILQAEREREAARRREVDTANQLTVEQKRRSQQFLWAAAITFLLAVIASSLGLLSNRNAAEARRQSATATIALATSQSALQNEQIANNAAQAAAVTAEHARSDAQQAQKAAETEAAHAQVARATAVAAEDIAQAQATQAEIARSSEAQARQAAEQNARRSQADNLAYAVLNQLPAKAYADSETIAKARQAVTTTWDIDGNVTDIAGHALFDTLVAIPTGHKLPEFAGRFTHILPSVDDQQVLTLDVNRTLTHWQGDASRATYHSRDRIGNVNLATWAGDSRQLAFVGDNILWIGKDIQQTQSFVLGITPPINHLAWQPGTNALALVNADTIAVVDGTTGEPLNTLSNLRAPMTAVDWSPNSKLLAMGDKQGGVALWDSAGNSLRRLQGATQTITALAWSPDSQQVAAASNDHFVYLWAADTGTLVRTLPEHTKGATYVVWGADSQQIITANGEGEVAIWQLTTQAKRVVRPSTAGPVTALQLNSHGDQLFALPSTGGVESWQIDPSIAQRTLLTHLGAISQIEPHPTTGQELVLNVRDQVVGVQAQQVISLSIPTVAGCNPGTCITQASWSQNGTQLALGTASGRIVISATRPVSGSFQAGACSDVTGCRVTTLAWNPVGTQLASGGSDGTVRLWDQDGKLLADGPHHQANAFGDGAVTVLAWQPSTGQLLSGGDDGVLYLWSGTSEVKPIPWKHLDSSVAAVAWNKTGNRLLAGSANGTLYLFMSDGQEQHRWSPHDRQPVLAVAWLADDTFASVGTDRTAKLWLTNPLDTPIFVVPLGDTPLSAAHFSRDGQRIITGNTNGVIQDWWVQPQDWLGELDKHTTP